jgi:hypothetical protein
MVLSLQVARALLQPRSFHRAKLPSLNADALKTTEFGAEAEAIDAELEGGAAAMEKALKKGFELDRAGDILLDFDEFPGGEFFPALADGSVVAETAEEELDFGERETHFGGEADEKDARESVAGIAALSASAVGRGEQAAFFVVADRGGVEASGAGELADFHSGFSLKEPAPSPARLTNRTS